MHSIRTKIIKIGNSRGIRIPKIIIDQVGLQEEVEISVERDHVTIRPTARPRQNWEEQFRAMSARGIQIETLFEPT